MIYEIFDRHLTLRKMVAWLYENDNGLPPRTIPDKARYRQHFCEKTLELTPAEKNLGLPAQALTKQSGAAPSTCEYFLHLPFRKMGGPFSPQTVLAGSATISASNCTLRATFWDNELNPHFIGNSTLLLFRKDAENRVKNSVAGEGWVFKGPNADDVAWFFGDHEVHPGIHEVWINDPEKTPTKDPTNDGFVFLCLATRLQK